MFWCVIFNIWADEPIYHLDSDIVGRTRCGREVAVHRPYLPLKHAKKFARICRGCARG